MKLIIMKPRIKEITEIYVKIQNLFFAPLKGQYSLKVLDNLVW